eukprot:TRINITY_DN6371_c0_g1_i5.p1 TRINITY_DN6371_c0_g1~~TRINITY_DN6371_c0_g1_i5.p1  ORF type:complete len:403 (-),score=150.17 TRINITY_DN6371_c0_g1_i5:37-1245(-)
MSNITSPSTEANTVHIEVTDGETTLEADVKSTNTTSSSTSLTGSLSTDGINEESLHSKPFTGLDHECEYLNGKTILVTGGTGSFGKTIIMKLLTEYDVKKIIVFSRDELKQWELQKGLLKGQDKVRFFLGDVRDRDRLYRAFRGVDVVIHAAALKQVPAAEYNPSEFVKTNVLGAMNIVDAAIDCGVQKVVALSTDKAANPVNLYGATKLCSDKLFIAANAYAGGEYPRFAVVRYGNVLGSRGSIIPFFKQLLMNGATELPITDERMTRFWITLPQAADFVIRCFEDMDGGELFVPKIPSMKIVDMARAVSPEATLKYIGIREGEKLHELLISPDDSRDTYEFVDHYVIAPRSFQSFECTQAERMEQRGGVKVEDGFSYASNINELWATKDDVMSVYDAVKL